MHGIKTFEHLTPRTATRPILLSEFLQQEKRSMVIDNARITPERKAWFARMLAEGKDVEKEGE